MNIDKNNWLLEVAELTDEQLKDVCQYLVGNYEKTTAIDVVILFLNARIKRADIFDYIGAFNKRLVNFSIPHDINIITYQDFLTHIKGVQMQTEKTSLVDQLKLAADTIKRLKAITGSDVEIDSNGVVRIEAFNNVFVIALDKRSEAEINSLIDSIIVLNEWD